MQQPDIDPDYYVHNFHKISGFVVATYEDLLSQSERDWYYTLCACSLSAQRLYIRLLLRQGSVFRFSKLQYDEIGDLSAAADELENNGLVSAVAPAHLTLILGLYTKPELIRILKLSALKSQPRAELVDSIARSPCSSRLGVIRRLQQADRWISVNGHNHWTLMQLCFFGNPYQDSRHLVLSELGALRYANYTISSEARAFWTRQQIDDHLRCYECQWLSEQMSLNTVSDIQSLAQRLPDAAHDVHLERRVSRLRNRMAKKLERLGDAQAAIDLYRQSGRPPARERIVRLMLVQGLVQQAAQWCEQIIKTPFNEAEYQIGTKLQVKCDKALGRSVSVPPQYKPTTHQLELSDSAQRVELAACEYYSQKGDCFFSENALVKGVLGLFIWDILFYPVKGVFFNPYQAAPVDFHEPEFMASRQTLFDQRWLELSDHLTWTQRVMSAFEQYYGTVNPLVHWHRLSPPLLQLALETIPSQHWRVMFDRILADTRENTSGLPDLVLFPNGGGYQFIEIKGPGDVLQANQRRWMAWFEQHEIPCKLVNVRFHP